ncbi:MAG: type II toxin-antitoxin system prevent-host-death family antitoxin [Patescibacteria group bacterium]
MTHTLPITKAREDLTTLVNNANKKLEEYVITVNGSPAAVLISAAQYDSWKETNDIMSDTKLLNAVKKGEKEIDDGKGIPWEDVKRDLNLE